MAKTRIKRGNKVYVYERENYRDEFGKVKHRKAKYLGIEETIDGKTIITPPKKRQKDIEITSSVRYGDIATSVIENDLPIKKISEHARREKSIRHGHISTLHICAR